MPSARGRLADRLSDESLSVSRLYYWSRDHAIKDIETRCLRCSCSSLPVGRQEQRASPKITSDDFGISISLTLWASNKVKTPLSSTSPVSLWAKIGVAPPTSTPIFDFVMNAELPMIVLSPTNHLRLLSSVVPSPPKSERTLSGFAKCLFLQSPNQFGSIRANRQFAILLSARPPDSLRSHRRRDTPSFTPLYVYYLTGWTPLNKVTTIYRHFVFRINEIE